MLKFNQTNLLVAVLLLDEAAKLLPNNEAPDAATERVVQLLVDKAIEQLDA